MKSVRSSPVGMYNVWEDGRVGGRGLYGAKLVGNPQIEMEAYITKCNARMLHCFTAYIFVNHAILTHTHTHTLAAAAALVTWREI